MRRQWTRADNLTICCRKKLIEVSFSCVSPVIDNEFRHNIVKIVCGSTRLSPRGSTCQLLWQCCDEIHDQRQDRRMKNWRQFVNFTWYRTSSLTEFKNSWSAGYMAQANMNSSHTSNLQSKYWYVCHFSTKSWVVEIIWERQAVNGNQWERIVLMPILVNLAAFC